MPAKDRGGKIELPGWWLTRVNQIFDARGENQTAVGRKLAAINGRSKAYTHGVISRFLANKNTTREVAEAFSILYGIPLPFFVPRSLEEAIDFQGIARGHDDVVPDAGSKTVERVRLARERLAILEESVKDHTDTVESIDEGRDRSRRTRRAARGRASSS